MADEVKKYAPAIYLDKNGYEGCRARIFLYGANDKFLGTISFHDPGMPPPQTGVGSQGQLWASSSFSNFDSVLDLLRHEGPVFYELLNGSYRITCSLEPAGEDET